MTLAFYRKWIAKWREILREVEAFSPKYQRAIRILIRLNREYQEIIKALRKCSSTL